MVEDEECSIEHGLAPEASLHQRQRVLLIFARFSFGMQTASIDVDSLFSKARYVSSDSL